MYDLLSDLMEDYVKEHERIERLRDTTIKRIFRIHWDGDFFSEGYAHAWARVIDEHPDISFWAYTRTFSNNNGCNVIPVLAEVAEKNLTLYLSVDSENQDSAALVFAEYPHVKAALLGQSFDEALESSVELISKKSPKCPEQTGAYPLIVPMSQQGACSECMMCVNGTNDVLFSISKK